MTSTREARLAWWHEAKFGMFVHWGLYSILTGEWKGKPIPSVGEWIMKNARIPIDEYEQLAGEFNPTAFDAEEWVRVAQDAGMKYFVITAKHHDGFCLFDSPGNPYNMVNLSPFKRDPMQELAEACGIADTRVLEWVNRADLMRVRGVSTQYSDLLEAAGVDTVKELRRRNAASLTEKMIAANNRKKNRLVRQCPAESQVQRWIDHAKTLDAVVKY